MKLAIKALIKFVYAAQLWERISFVRSVTSSSTSMIQKKRYELNIFMYSFEM